MNYISYPEVHAPKDQEQSPVSVNSLKSTEYIYSLETKDSSPQSEKTVQSMDSLKTTPTTDQTAQEEHKAATTAHGPKSPQVSWCKNAVTINGKTHPLPTTKEYILHKYADVFKGVGTLTGSPYHIKLKDSYKPVQHPPRSVPLGMQSAYKAELDRPVKKGIVPVMKEDSSL